LHPAVRVELLSAFSEKGLESYPLGWNSCTRQLGMMEGVDLGFDAAFFIGDHASALTVDLFMD